MKARPCRYCEVEIFWATSEKSGKAVPLEVKPIKIWVKSQEARTRVDPVEPKVVQRQGFRNHFETCPGADQARKAAAAKREAVEPKRAARGDPLVRRDVGSMADKGELAPRSGGATVTPERRRESSRKSAQRKRDREMAERRSGKKKCPRRFGLYGKCGALLVYETTRDGGVRVRCLACERMKRGICADCPRRVEGAPRRARRCAACKRIEHARARERCTRKDPKRRQRMNRKTFANRQADPERRERTLEYKRAWRQANPEKVRAQKRREGLRQSDRYKNYHAAYRAARVGQRSAVALGHDCKCGAPLTGRTKKCEECKARACRVAQLRLQNRRGRGRRTDLERTG